MTRSPAELFQTPTLCKDGEIGAEGPSEPGILRLTIKPFPLSAGWLSPELLALWTHCAQVPPRMLRQRPQPEMEEVPEERRKTEALSEIEVTTSRAPCEPLSPNEL